MKMLLRVAMALLGMTAAIAAAQTAPAPSLSIDGPTVYKPYQMVKLVAKDVPPKAALLWRVSPATGVQRATTAKHMLQFVAPPGTYTVELQAFVFADGQLDVVVAQAVVEVQGTPPPPSPGPGPVPPAPTPPGRSAGAAALTRLSFPGAGCTATVVGPRRADGRWDILTAAHCVPNPAASGVATLKDGRRLAVRVTARNATCDLCWLVTDSADLTDLPAALLAKQSPQPGTPIYHSGYGWDKPGNREEGTVYGHPNVAGLLPMTLSVSNGDSGGGIFTVDGDWLISAVCCTRGIARKDLMFGGSSEMANRLRPRSAADGFPDLTDDRQSLNSVGVRPGLTNPNAS